MCFSPIHFNNMNMNMFNIAPNFGMMMPNMNANPNMKRKIPQQFYDNHNNFNGNMNMNVNSNHNPNSNQSGNMIRGGNLDKQINSNMSQFNNYPGQNFNKMSTSNNINNMDNMNNLSSSFNNIAVKPRKHFSSGSVNQYMKSDKKRSLFNDKKKEDNEEIDHLGQFLDNLKGEFHTYVCSQKGSR